MRAWFRSAPVAAAEFSDEELELGIDGEMVAFVSEMCGVPMTFVEFPVECVLLARGVQLAVEETRLQAGRSPVPLPLSARQVRHGELMLARSEALRKLRLRLCPRVMDEDLFWAVYFLLTKQHLRRVGLEAEVVLGDEEEEEEEEEGEGEKKEGEGEGEKKEGDEAKKDRSPPSLSDWQDALSSPRALKRLVRSFSVPSELRSSVWSSLLSPPSPPPPLSSTLSSLFGPLVPSLLLSPPMFGSSLPVPSSPSARRLLASLALQCGHVFAPQLPRVAELLSSHFPEEIALDMASRLLRHSLSSSSSPAALSSVLLISRPLHLDWACAALGRLIELNFPRLHARMALLGVSPSRFAAPWFCSLFDGIVPSEELFSRWIFAGPSLLHHLALALLFANASLLAQCDSASQFLLVLSASHKRLGPSLFRCADAVRLKQRAWTQLIADSDRWWKPPPPSSSSAASFPPLEPYVRPPVSDLSRVLDGLDQGFFWEQLYELALPPRRRTCRAVPVFTSDRDGKSLLTLRKCIAEDLLHLLLLRCEQRGTIGVLFSHLDSDDGEMVVFGMATGGDSRLECHSWKGGSAVRPSIQMSQGIFVAENAVALDEDLATGISRPTVCFGNTKPLLPPLDSFECSLIELWQFE